MTPPLKMKSRSKRAALAGRVLIQPDESFAPLAFVVSCVPVPTRRRTARPVHLRGRVVSYIEDKDGSHAVMRQKLELAARTAAGGRTILGPVALEVTYYFDWPASAPAARADLELPHTGTPDLDNLEKAVMDAITRSKLWGDDRQVSHKNTMKRCRATGGPAIYVWIGRDTCEEPPQ